MATFSVRPVGWVRAGRDDPANTDHWGDVESTIVLEERFGDECLAGLAEFSHVEVVSCSTGRASATTTASRAARADATTYPRSGSSATAARADPTRIGVTSCRIRAVAGRELCVQGLHAVVGTPVLDLKPVMREFLARDVRQPAWVGALMGEYFQP